LRFTQVTWSCKPNGRAEVKISWSQSVFGDKRSIHRTGVENSVENRNLERPRMRREHNINMNLGAMF